MWAKYPLKSTSKENKLRYCAPFLATLSSINRQNQEARKMAAGIKGNFISHFQAFVGRIWERAPRHKNLDILCIILGIFSLTLLWQKVRFTASLFVLERVTAGDQLSCLYCVCSASLT